MKVRKANVDDAAEACTVLRRSITELCYEDHCNNEGFLEAWLSNKTVANVTRWILQEDVFVADGDGTIMGVAAMNRTGKITLNYVSPDFRFRGVSRALVHAMEANMRALSIPVSILESTISARGFYEKLGYQPTEEIVILSLTGTPVAIYKKWL